MWQFINIKIKTKLNPIKYIPNSITSLNLLSGCISILFAFKGQLDLAGYSIFAAAIFDFFDGFAARLLKANSPIGLQLDSLADMVSFGLAPSIMLYVSIETQFNENLFALLPFSIAIFSALRLAKFNIDTRQTESFIGMPTPACAILVASSLIHIYSQELLPIPLWSASIIAILLSILLVSEIPMFSLKVKKQDGVATFIRKYLKQLLFLGITLVLMIVLQFGGLACGILLYLLISIGDSFYKKIINKH